MFGTDGGGKRSGELGVDRCAAFTFREERRPNNDTLRTRIEHLTRALDGVDSAAGLTGQTARNLLHECEVVALAHGGVKINQLHQRESRKLLDPVFKVVEGEAQFLALH